MQFVGQSPPCLKGGFAPQGRGDIKPKYYDIPQSNCLKSAICQPPLGKGAKAASGGKQTDKLKFIHLTSREKPRSCDRGFAACQKTFNMPPFLV